MFDLKLRFLDFTLRCFWGRKALGLENSNIWVLDYDELQRFLQLKNSTSFIRISEGEFCWFQGFNHPLFLEVNPKIPLSLKSDRKCFHPNMALSSLVKVFDRKFPYCYFRMTTEFLYSLPFGRAKITSVARFLSS